MSTAPPARTADGPADRTARPPIAAVLAGYAAVVAVCTTVAVLGAGRNPARVHADDRGWIDAWLIGDAGWYQSIATGGYFYHPGQQSSIAFFPTYPMAVGGLGRLLGGDFHLAGWLVSLLAGAAAVVAFTVWVWPRLPRPAAVTAIALLVLYPYAFFLHGALYSDSTFLLLAVAAFLAVERRWYWTAGLIGALATAGRPVGIAVAAGLVVRTLEQLAERGGIGIKIGTGIRTVTVTGTGTVTGNGPGTGTGPARPGSWPAHPRPVALLRAVRRVRWREIGVLVSGLGLAGWMIYLGTSFGDPLAFATVQAAPGWNQGGGPRTWFKFDYVGTLLWRSPDLAVRLTAQALMVLLAVLLLRRVWRLFGWGYLAYAVVVLAIPLLGTKDFMGTGRYVLAAFPVIAAGGHLLATTRFRWLRPVVLTLFGAGLLVATAVFASGVPVT
ncbi:hypothetical protein [Nakamurella sp.]|uniref:hypothetical protein n=1 Tax=Nakamurella sp. TaxID=1869182 RepID=UPI003B3A3F8B